MKSEGKFSAEPRINLLKKSIFFDVLEGGSYRRDDKGGKGAFLALNSGFHFLDHIVGKPDGFIGGRRNRRDFKFSHFISSQCKCIAYSLKQNKDNLCIAFAMHI